MIRRKAIGARETSDPDVRDGGVQSVTIEGTGESEGYRANSASVAKGTQSLRDIPQSVAVGNRALIDAQGARSVPSVAEVVPPHAATRKSVPVA